MKSNKITFSDCIKDCTTDQDKAVSPERTVAHFYEKTDGLDLDILGKITRVDNGRLGIPVYFSVCGEDAYRVIGKKKQMGKGSSPAQAKASACMELAERFSFFSFRHNRENFIEGDYGRLKEQGYPVLDPLYLLQSVLDETMSRDQLVELLADVKMQWCFATNITRNEEVLIPFTWFSAINEYNGSSAGNTLEEAAIQGISEVVERHVCSLIAQDKISVPEIDLDTVTDPLCKELIGKFTDNGIVLKLYDFSLDLGITTVAALAWDPATFPEKSEIVITAGTTPSPDKAIVRAVTEVAQLAGDFNTNANYEASGLPKPNTLDDIDYLLQEEKKVSVNKLVDISDKNMFTEISSYIAVLQRQGMDIFIVDITHDKLDVPALYTFIPGTHFRERASEKSAGLFAAKIIMESSNDYETLDTRLRKMEEILSDSYYIAFYRGKLFYDTGSLDQAVASFKKALKHSPSGEDHASICSYYGSALSQLERYDEAVEILKEGLTADDQRLDIHNLLGVCYFKQARYDKAITCFERAVAIDPSSAMDYANLGVNYSKLGKNGEAIQFLTLAVTLDPDLDFAKNLLDNLLVQTSSK